ncbi:MAG TPA: WbqC family protein [Thermoanaerobaculia bacterium]|nr:WbqC family protein [Thermoanaerobaculia bacterium]
MAKRVAILQSSYIPWKGYFDIIHDVDDFIFLDDVQYTRQDWRNRNRIKTARGAEWLTIPVGTDLKRRICDVELPQSSWAAAHWRRIADAYANAPHFATYRPLFEDLYLGRRWTHLSEFNQHAIRAIAGEILGLRTQFHDSRGLAPGDRGQQRVLDILRAAAASVYVSGPAAKAYIDPQRFDDAGVELVWKDYSGYPQYPQHHPPLVHEVTILDLLFHTGPDAPWYIWGWRAEPG